MTLTDPNLYLICSGNNLIPTDVFGSRSYISTAKVEAITCDMSYWSEVWSMQSSKRLRLDAIKCSSHACANVKDSACFLEIRQGQSPVIRQSACLFGGWQWWPTPDERLLIPSDVKITLCIQAPTVVYDINVTAYLVEY